MTDFVIELEGRDGDVIEFDVTADTPEEAEQLARDKAAALTQQFEARATGSPRGEEGSLTRRATSTPQLILDEAREGARSFARNLGINLIDIFGADNAALEARLNEMRRVGTVEQQQSAFRVKNDIPKVVSQASDLTGQVFPEVIAGGGAGQIRAGIPRILAEGGVGALGGLGSELNLENAMSNAWLGGGLGLGLSSGMWFYGSGRQALQRTLRGNRAVSVLNPAQGPSGGAGITGDLARENELLFRTFDPTGSISPTASELSQSGFAAEWESLVRADPGTTKSRFFTERSRAIVDTFEEVTNALNVRGLSTPQVMNSTLDAIDSNINKLRANRQNAWNNTMSEAVRKTGGDVKFVGGRTVFSGGAAVIDGKITTEAFQNVVDDVVEQLDQGLISQAEADRVFNFARKWNQKGLAQSGNLTVADSQQLLVDLTNEIDGTGKVFKSLGPREGRTFAVQLKDAALADLDTTIGSGNIGGEAADLIREARDTYRSLSRGIDGFQQLGLSRLAAGTPTEFINTFRNMDPTILRETLQELDNINPETSNALRGRLLADSFDKARIPDPTGNVADKVDFKRVVDDIVEGDFGLDRFEALFPAATPRADVARARAGLQVLQRITSDAAVLGASDIGARTGAAGIREVSLTGAEGGLGFKVRAFLSAMFPGMVERALYSPQGVRALIKIGEAAEGIRLRAPAGASVTGGRSRSALNAALREYHDFTSDLITEQERAEAAQAKEDAEEQRARGLANAMTAPFGEPAFPNN